jgi:hypothetical protein
MNITEFIDKKAIKPVPFLEMDRGMKVCSNKAPYWVIVEELDIGPSIRFVNDNGICFRRYEIKNEQWYVKP